MTRLAHRRLPSRSLAHRQSSRRCRQLFNGAADWIQVHPRRCFAFCRVGSGSGTHTLQGRARRHHCGGGQALQPILPRRCHQHEAGDV